MHGEMLRKSLKAGVVSLSVLAAAAATVGCPPACTVPGTDGPDVLVGDPNKDDVICGFGGDDELYGLGGNDTLRGGAGNDLLDGGGGNDWADFTDSPNGVFVNLATGVASGNGSDTLVSIRRVRGSAFVDWILGDDNDNTVNGGNGNDFIRGGSGADVIRGEAGNDTMFGDNGPDEIRGDGGDDVLDGGRGDDQLFGGDGTDWASYAYAPSGVLASNAASQGGDDNDTLAGIENLEGSEFQDVLSATVPDAVIRPGLGDDFVFGDGTTTIDYSSGAAGGVVVDLVAGTATGGSGSDDLSGIKHITGSFWDDELSGNNQKNTILGGNGNDLLRGRANDDTLDGGLGAADVADGGADTDTCTAESETNCEL